VTAFCAPHPRSRVPARGRWLTGLIVAFTLGGLGLSVQSRGQEAPTVLAQARHPTRLVHIDAENRPLKEVIKDLMRQADVDYVFDPSAAEELAKPFSIRIKDVSVDFALRRLLAASPVTFIVGGTLAGEPGAAAKIRLTYTFYHIAACRPRLPALLVYQPPESQLAAASELFARVMAASVQADVPVVDMEPVSLEYLQPEQVIELLEPLTTWSSQARTLQGRPLYTLGALAEQFTDQGAARLQQMEEEIAQKKRERDQLAEKAGADSPQVLTLDAELDELRAQYVAVENDVANQIASIMRRIVPGGPLPVYLADAGEGELLVMGTREAIDRARRAIAVIDQPPPQAELEAYADITLISGNKPYRFNLSARGVGRVGQTLVMTNELSPVPQSTLKVKVTPRAATRESVALDTSWDLSAQLKGAPLTVPVVIKQELESSPTVQSGKRVIVGSWALTGSSDLKGTLTFGIAARSVAGPRVAAPAAPPVPPAASPKPPATEQ